MRNQLPIELLLLVGLVVLLAYVALTLGEPDVCPDCQPVPPIPKPDPILPKRPVYFTNGLGRVGPNGKEPQADYPPMSEKQWLQNIGSEIDNAGMCVFSAYEMMCRYHGLEAFRGFRDWAAKKYKGGGWPDKLALLVKEYCTAKGIKEPGWWQYDGPLDAKTTAMLETYLRNGGMGCTTLYFDERYGSQKIYHWVNLVHVDGSYFAVMDNNFDDSYRWSTINQASRKLTNGGRIWVAGLLEPGPAPVPFNRRG